MIHWAFERFFNSQEDILLALNKKNKESLKGVNITKMQQGGWDNKKNPSIPNGTNVDTGDSAIIISEEDGQTPGTLLKTINDKSSAGSNKTNSYQRGGANVSNPSKPNTIGCYNGCFSNQNSCGIW